jgi:carboxyl-terminal processing protease
VKNRFSAAVALLLVFTFAIPARFSAQQQTQQGGAARQPSSTGVTTERPRTTADAPASRAGTTSPTGTARPATAEGIARELAEALAVIEEHHVDGSKLDYNDVFKSSINGTLRALDPHSNYFDPQEFEKFITEQRSEYFGIGAVIGDLRDAGEVNTYIRATFENSPAWRAGLRYGDRVVAVNDKSMRGKTFSEVREHLLGPRGTKVKVTVARLGTDKEEVFDITRDAVSRPSIPEAYMIRPGVGYVAMTGGFNTTTSDEFRDALADLHGQGMRMLVLDLRGNGGGLLREAVRVANTFLRRGQLILTQKGRIRGSSQIHMADNESPDPTPLVVLVNGQSASASEIVAGALQDHDRALIVGENSFGKGLVQLPFQLEYGSAMLLTIAKYYTPSGRLIQRDYSQGGLYDYYTRGGYGSRDEQGKPQTPATPAGPVSRTDTGRVVYGGGGIMPDEIVQPRLISPAQQRLADPIFAFALKLAAGQVAGFEGYKVQRPIEFEHDLKPSDFPMNEALFKSFKEFVASKPSYGSKHTAVQLDRERSYIERQLRYELATAAFGSNAAFQVFNIDDPQIMRAIELLPRARDLAQSARRAPLP